MDQKLDQQIKKINKTKVDQKIKKVRATDQNLINRSKVRSTDQKLDQQIKC